MTAPNPCVVSVRRLRPNDPNICYVGRTCAGWNASPLANRNRLAPGETPGTASEKFRLWLLRVARMAFVAPADLSPSERAAWQELNRLAAELRQGKQIVLGCWCAAPGAQCAETCHGWVVARAVRWLAAKEG